MRRSGSARLLLAGFVFSALAWAQGAAGVLRGKVTDSAGTPIPGATISIEGQPGTALRTVRANASGAYAATDLAAGVYQVTASAPGFTPVTGSVQVTETAPTIWNAVTTSSLSLSSLGFPASATQGDAAEQARLNRRARMLKIHQTLGLITTVPLAATVATGFFAGGRATSSNVRNLHAGLGISSAALYGLTAYYAIAAPRLAGQKEHGPIRLHEIMAWIHGPGMVLTPILGTMAYQQRSRGEHVHGVAQLHSAVALGTIAAYTVAILAVTKHSGPPKPIRTGFNWMFHRHAATVNSPGLAQ